MICVMTSSFCIHEGYRRGRKSCAFPYVPAWLATRGNLYYGMLSYNLPMVPFLWRSSVAIGRVKCAGKTCKF